MIAPRWLEAHTDRALRGVRLAVYDELWRMINPVIFKPVKLASLSRRVHVCESAARSALLYLVAHQYLECGPNVGRIRSYRLVWRQGAPRPLQKDKESF